MSNRTSLSFCALAAIAALIVTAGFPQPAFSSGLTVFSKTYIRETQKPQVFTDTFLCSTPSDSFTLIVQNGKYGKDRVAAALVWVNGKEVFGVDSFNEQVERLTATIRLLKKNEVKVELRGKPGSFITLNIVGEGMNTPPVAEAGADQTQAVGTRVTLDGSRSQDADGDPLSYLWTIMSRPADSAAALSDPHALRPTFVIDKPGTYEVELIVSDGKAMSLPDTVLITTINSAPVADAGPDQVIHIVTAVTVRLDGSKSSDVDRDQLTYAWTFVRKPQDSLAVLVGAITVQPSFVMDLPGEYLIRLVVNDGKLDSAPDEVLVTAANAAPVADAGGNRTAYVTNTVVLDGSKSHDPEGDPITFRWALLSTPSGSNATLSDPTAVKPEFTIDRFGDYQVQLIVSDGWLQSAPARVLVTTLNSAPVAEAGADQTMRVTQTVQLDGGHSIDVDGNPLTYRWSLVTMPAGSRAVLSDVSAIKPTFVIDVFGIYVAQLIVNDGKLDSPADTVTISTENSPPQAEAGPDQTVRVTQTVQLDGSGSTDVDGNRLTFRWSLTSKPEKSAATLSDPAAVRPTFVADAFGTYVAQLIVNDGKLDSNVDTVTISTENSAPVAEAGPDQTVSKTKTVQLDGSHSSDVDGNPLTYRWSLTSVPQGSTAVLSDATAMKPTFVADLAGAYVAQLIVSDGTVDSPADTVMITTLNSKPVAEAGANQQAIQWILVALNGNGSSDANRDALTYRWSITSSPPSSAAVLVNAASVQPTFVPDLPGTYLVQLIVNDGTVDSDPDTVTVTVAPNRPPLSGNDSFTTAEDGPLVVGAPGVLINDTDPDGNLITAVLQSTTARGTLVLSANGAFTYTPSLNFNGMDTFTYVASDGHLAGNVATVTITVSAVNDPPTANAGPDQSAYTGNSVNLNGAGSSDPDGDPLTYQWSFVSTPGGSTAAIANATTVTPSFIPDKAGTYRVQLVVSDGKVSSPADTVDIVATIVNGSPVAQNISISIASNLQAKITLSGSDPDGDPLTYSVATNPSHGSLSGTAPILTYTPEPNYLGQESFTYKVEDGKGGTATATVSISICLNLSGLAAYYPFNGNANDQSGNGKHGTVSGALLTADRDGNDNNAYSFDGVDDYISVANNGALSFTGSFSISLWVRNQDDFSKEQNGNYIISKGVSGEPYYNDYALGIGNTYRYWLSIYTTTGTFVVSSANSFPDNRFHHVVAVYDQGNSELRLYVDGVLENKAAATGSVFNRNNTFYIGDWNGSSSWHFWKGAIDDIRIFGRALSDSEAACALCAIANKPPFIKSMPLTAAGIGYEYSYPVIANDPDADPLKYSIPVAPAGMTIDQSGVIRWTPATASDFRVLVQVTDGYGGIGTQDFWIRVGKGNAAASNTPPIAHAGDDFTMDEDKQDQLDGSYSYDADGDHLTYTWTQIAGPAVELDSATVQKPRFTAPLVDRNTVLTFQLVVNDGTTDSAPAKVNVMVLNTDIWPDGSGMVTNCNPDGPGSLKAAVDYANSHPGTRITFSIPEVVDPAIGPSCYGVNTPGVWTLKVPEYGGGLYGMHLEGDGTFFDGASQTENQGDRNPFGPEIEITESNVTYYPFRIAANDVVVRGIVLNRQSSVPGYAPTLSVQAGDHAVIVGNYIGTDATGTIPLAANYGDCNACGGLMVDNGNNYDYTKKSVIRNLRIGGSRPGEGNVISVFNTPSIYIVHMNEGHIPSNASLPKDAPGPITIQGNMIGMDRTGSQPLGLSVPYACAFSSISVTHFRHLLIGGVTPGSRNIMAALWMGIQVSEFGAPFDPNGNLTIQGNYIGTDATGLVTFGKGPFGVANWAIGLMKWGEVMIPDGVQWAVGGSIPGAGNLIVGSDSGISMSDVAGAIPSIKVQGNFIGTNVTGTEMLGNMSSGIAIYGSRVHVGGTGPGEGNVIGGLSNVGIYVSGSMPQTYLRPSLIEIKGNKIGVGADGLTPIPTLNGITTGTNFPLIIGGTEPGAGNMIAFNRNAGLVFGEGWDGNYYRGWFARVLGNRIFDNGGQGMTGRGNTNDPGDADLGWPIYHQNFPVLNPVEVVNGATHITGFLDTQSPEQCLIEIFANRVADPSGFGEGEQWVAALYPQADKTFSITIPQDLTGKYLTATATRMTPLSGYASTLNSSEFSKAVLVGTAPSTNLPPVITSAPVITGTSETPYSYQLIASDPEGKALRYSLALAPAGMTIGSSGLIIWTPTIQQEGRQVVTVAVYDPEGLYAFQNFLVQVEPLVDIVFPTISPSLPQGLSISAPYQVTGTICDTHLVGYQIEIAPSGTQNFAVIASGSGCVNNGVLGTIDPTRLANGTYILRFTAWDDAGNLTVFNITDPVEVKGKLKIGQFSLAFQDISVPVSGIPINVTRSYNSFDKTQGDFGTGWSMALGTGVKVQVTRNLGTEWDAEKDYFFDPGGTGQGAWVYKLTSTKVPKVLVTYADGRQDRFEYRPYFTTQPAFDTRYVTARYVALQGTTSTLEAVADTDLFLIGSQLYDTDMEPYNPATFKLTTSDGTVLMISKAAGLQSLADRNGNTLTFGPAGITHSAGLSITMQRDIKGRVIKITDPMGRAVSYLCNANDDLASFTDQAGNVTKYGYDSDHNLISIIDTRGIQILKVQYDADGRMIGSVDGLGKTTQVTHDPATATEYVKDRNGNTTVYRYDTDGNILSQTDPLGHTTSYTYDANGNQLTRTDPLGNTWIWTYDAKNNKLSESDPLGNTKRWTYNSNNQVLNEIDALGRVTAYEYDVKGNLQKKTDAMGNLTTHAYDWRGNRTSTTDCYGTTTYEYNAAGYKIRETDALGHITTYTYDSNGNELTMTRTRTTDSGPVTMTTTKEYDSSGRLVKQTDPDGSFIVTEYNGLGKKSATVDKRGNRTTYEYDPAGNLTRTTYPDGKTEVNTYDGNGNRVTYADRAGRVTTFVYDAVKYGEGEQGAQNRLIQTIFADGSNTHIEYDAAGRISATVDENGNRTTFAYDGAGRRTASTDGLGNVTTVAYDANGNQTGVTDANGNRMSYEYDALDRKSKELFSDGTFTVTAYAGCGTNRRIAESDQAGSTTHFAYDALGRLTSVTDALGGVTSYTYDVAGNKLTQTDPNGHATTWAYDNMGRATKRTLPLGMYETYTYDPNGNLRTKTDFNGSTTTYSYDVMNRLTKKSYPDASQVTYTYTATGRRASVTDARGTVTNTYGARDRLTSVRNPDGSTLDYTYDLKGNRTSVKVASGTTNYVFDPLNRLLTVTDPDGNVTIYTYDKVGNRATVAYPNGTLAEYRYDVLNRLTYLENRKTSGDVISSYAYTLGPNGNRTRVAENTGRVVDYAYDALNRLIAEQTTDATLGNQTVSYTYDAFGNRLTKTDGTGTTTYAYNSNDQLVTETAPSYSAAYEYDTNGNTTKKTQGGTFTTYKYDFENRLVSSQTGSQQVTYEYDADGTRTKSVTSTGTTKYLVDKNLRYAQVLEERDVSNTLIVSYVHGDDLISQKRAASASYYHYDGTMSTRKITDDSGNATDAYVYDAFGGEINRTGLTINGYLYSGEQYDANVGFYYLRARYYNPVLGRFMTHDPRLGDPYDPISLHRYVYANSNPVAFVDPSGETTLQELSETVMIVGVHAAMASITYTSIMHALGIGSSTDAVVWRGTLFYGGAQIPGARWYRPGAGGLFMIADLVSDCYCGKKSEGTFFIIVVGVDMGPLSFSVGATTASPLDVPSIEAGLVMRTPGLFGTKTFTLSGPAAWLSATAVASYTVMTMGMGMGELSWTPGAVVGIDLGLNLMGGISLPVHTAGPRACVR